MSVAACQEGELKWELKLPPDKRINIAKSSNKTYETSSRVQSGDSFSVKLRQTLDKIFAEYEKRFDDICEQSRQSLEIAFQSLKNHAKEPAKVCMRELCNPVEQQSLKKDTVFFKRLEVFEQPLDGMCKSNVLADQKTVPQHPSKIETFTRHTKGIKNFRDTSPNVLHANTLQDGTELTHKAVRPTYPSLFKLEQQPLLPCEKAFQYDQFQPSVVNHNIKDCSKSERDYDHLTTGTPQKLRLNNFAYLDFIDPFKTAKNIWALNEEQALEVVAERSLQKLENLDFGEQGTVTFTQLIQQTDDVNILVMNSISDRVQNWAENDYTSRCE
jgi:hypothetical protein